MRFFILMLGSWPASLLAVIVGGIAALLHVRGWPATLAVTILDPALPSMLSRRATCREGGFGLSTLKLLLAEKTLRQVRVRNRSLIPKAELERYLSVLLNDSGGQPD